MNLGKTRQRGVVILEALIAILIFSMGILALVGMQAVAINNVADAKYRSTAGFLADQIVGTVWATRIADPIAAASNAIAYNPDPTFCTPVACGGAVGNAYTQAWVASVAQLPNGTASIAITNFPPLPAIPVASMVTVTVGWKPPKEPAVNPPHRHVVSAFVD